MVVNHPKNLNFASFSKNVTLTTVINKDKLGNLAKKILKKYKVNLNPIYEHDRPTTEKSIYISKDHNLLKVNRPIGNVKVNLLVPSDFQLNKFLYKQIGKKFQWTDSLSWQDKDWKTYVSNKNLITYILKKNEDLAGFCEVFHHKEKKEIEIIYFGLLEEYFGEKLGGYMLSEVIKKSFKIGVKRIWLPTCALDHKNALNNYLSRGMEIFSTKNFQRKIA